VLDQIIVIPALLLSSFLPSPPAWATSFYPQPFPESVQAAPIIVRGKTGMSYADWSSNDAGGRRIYTFYELQPTEILKGQVSASSPLTLRELGGEKDGVGLTVPGVAQFERGEDTLVFLKERNTNGTYDIQGMMMGKYSFQKDADGTEYLTGMGLNEVHSNAPSHLPQKWTLEDLRQLIRTQAPAQPQQNPAPAQEKPPLAGEARSGSLPFTLATPHTPAVTSAAPLPANPPPFYFSFLIYLRRHFWLSFLTFIGAIGLWQYQKAGRKDR